MEDKKIIQLYFERSETAIAETATKYGKLCHTIAYNILYNEEDTQECVNDTYLKAWEVIPPQIPEKLAAFLGKITRNFAISKYRHNSSLKRGGGQVACALEELEECVTVDLRHADRLADLLSDFLESQEELDRKLFMGRYWHAVPVKDLADEYGMTPNAVSLRLHRVRGDLRAHLEERGYRI